MSSDGAGAEAFVAVGSNVAPWRNVPIALKLLEQRTTVTASSTFYRTAPIGPPGQPPFVNGVWRLFAADVDTARRHLQEVERACGRLRTRNRYAPRPIDLDLVLFGDLVADQPDLKLPHDDLWRPFVGVCVLELVPELRVPGLGRRLRDVLGERHGKTVAAMTPSQIDQPLTDAVHRILAG
ncbi:MAG: 2-amino-4-hydroxy-6-hydroxymethyldihydropteridine diphosphokinase [Phycisphaerae bacterium]|nr:2-amino-4-hydroxy-6-hydroxymethyldihydropteridine diphosphokinase [Phycisphaerae bacterium]